MHQFDSEFQQANKPFMKFTDCTPAPNTCNLSIWALSLSQSFQEQYMKCIEWALSIFVKCKYLCVCVCVCVCGCACSVADAEVFVNV